MKEKQLLFTKAEENLLSKEKIYLPPRQRLELLLKTETYKVVKRRTAAEGQIREMIDFYNLCCLMLCQYFSSGQAENNFFFLSVIASQENTQSLTNEKMTEAFKLLRGYEELERKIMSIQMLFYQYQYSFPDLYEAYDLESISTVKVSDLIMETKKMMNNNPQCVEKILNRWELLA